MTLRFPSVRHFFCQTHLKLNCLTLNSRQVRAFYRVKVSFVNCFKRTWLSFRLIYYLSAPVKLFKATRKIEQLLY